MAALAGLLLGVLVRDLAAAGGLERSEQSVRDKRRPHAPSQPPTRDAPRSGQSDAPQVGPERLDLARLKQLFRRPPDEVSQVPLPVLALGARLFREPMLSADHRMSCATCHIPERGFVDGRRTALGNRGRALARNTPALWNLAPARAFYWDGRVTTLEAQVKDAIEREHEMDSTLEAAVHWLGRDSRYVAAFERAGRRLDGAALVDAIAAYQRTLVSPQTRFDRWVAGDEGALDPGEKAGFAVFTGKGRCLACHGGWRFTDDGFHDIGLRSKDRGRAAISPGPTGERTFKTPSLREARWTGPYMHDGSLRSLSEVVAHYAGRLQPRPSLAPELRQPLDLNAQERRDLVAFLRTLSSETRPVGP